MVKRMSNARGLLCASSCLIGTAATIRPCSRRRGLMSTSTLRLVPSSASTGWEFTEISISTFPEKRAEMFKLADRLTVPQIFFNDRHVSAPPGLPPRPRSLR